MNKPRFGGMVVIGMLAAMGAGAQSDPWGALRFLERKWEGPASGEPGRGISSREFRFDLNGRFFRLATRASGSPSRPGPSPKFMKTSACTVTTRR